MIGLMAQNGHFRARRLVTPCCRFSAQVLGAKESFAKVTGMRNLNSLSFTHCAQRPPITTQDEDDISS